MSIVSSYRAIRNLASVHYPLAQSRVFSIWPAKDSSGLVFETDLLFKLAKLYRQSPKQIFDVIANENSAFGEFRFRAEGVLCFEPALTDSQHESFALEVCVPLSLQAERLVLIAALQSLLAQALGFSTQLRFVEEGEGTALPSIQPVISSLAKHGVIVSDRRSEFIHRTLWWTSGLSDVPAVLNSQIQERPKKWLESFDLSDLRLPETLERREEMFSILFSLCTAAGTQELEVTSAQLRSSENVLWFAASFLERAKRFPEFHEHSREEGKRFDYLLEIAAVFGRIPEFIEEALRIIQEGVYALNDLSLKVEPNRQAIARSHAWTSRLFERLSLATAPEKLVFSRDYV